LAATGSAKTVWLCLPGHHPDPCAPGLSTTVYSPSYGKLGVEHPQAVKHPAIDCFYVYPTVSGQPTGNANLTIDPEERSIALYQAARYSQYCRVFAPMYRQETLAGIGISMPPTTTPNPAEVLGDVENAFEAYLRTYNHGRGFVLIGHSQGSFALRAVIAKLVDPKPSVRHRLLSAILMGGNVLVEQGKGIGGDFKHIPACRSDTQLGCVIAWSTFDQPPPATGSLFGVPPKSASGMQVLCTNPAALAGGTGVLDPISPSAPFDAMSALSGAIKQLGVAFPTPPTVWWTAPGAYSAECETLNGATVLEIKARDGAPTPMASPTPGWGLHLLDANIALGNLLDVVKHEAAAFAAGGR
jgi:hypothetical protein